MQQLEDLVGRYAVAADSAERQRLEREVWSRYGVERAVMVLDSQGFSRRTQRDGLVAALAAVARLRHLLTRSLRARHPQVTLTVLSLSSIDIQRGLDTFDLEAGVTYLDNEPLLRVRSLPLYRERYFLVTGEATHFPHRRGVTWAEAASLPLCLLTPEMQNRRIVDAAFRAAGAAPTPRRAHPPASERESAGRARRSGRRARLPTRGSRPRASAATRRRRRRRGRSAVRGPGRRGIPGGAGSCRQ